MTFIMSVSVWEVPFLIHFHRHRKMASPLDRNTVTLLKDLFNDTKITAPSAASPKKYSKHNRTNEISYLELNISKFDLMIARPSSHRSRNVTLKNLSQAKRFKAHFFSPVTFGKVQLTQFFKNLWVLVSFLLAAFFFLTISCDIFIY